jgi:hypothetical protein
MATPPSYSNARFTQVALIVEEIDDFLDTETPISPPSSSRPSEESPCFKNAVRL